MPEDPRPPRFPYVAALLCAACLGAAAWTWMRYSYAWPLIPSSFYAANDAGRLDPDWSKVGWYVCVRGKVGTYLRGGRRCVHYPDLDWWLTDLGDAQAFIFVRVAGPEAEPRDDEQETRWTGRVTTPFEHLPGGSWWGPHVIVDTIASRFTGASIAGLVVGAMGVFVFAFALRDWLRERRKFREGARRPGNGVERAEDA